MPVDTSIYGNIRPFTMEDPAESAAKAYALRDAQRKYRLERDVQDAAISTGGDPALMSKSLMSKGHVAPAMQLQGEAAKQRKAQVDEQLKLSEAVASDAMMLDQTWRQALQESGGDKVTALAKVQPIYGNVRAKWAQMGKKLPDAFDPDQNFAGIGAAKEAIQYLKTIAVEPTELGRLQRERDALSVSDPRRAEYDRVIKSYKAGRGTDVTVNTGPMTPGKTGANKIDEDMLGVTRNLMQLDAISSQFKPEYQRFQDKAGFMALSVKDSTVGLNNKEKKDLTEYSQYRRNAFNTLNEYIKSITGAAMTNAEADRILKGLPSPGTGLFDGDSPTEFKAKLDDAIQKTKMSVARLAYMKRNGMSLEDGQGNATIPLERMPQLINERGKAIEAELKAKEPKVADKALQRAVRRQLGVEFGLVSD